MSRIGKQKALNLLRDMLGARMKIKPAQGLIERTSSWWLMPKWDRDARVTVQAVFGKDSDQVSEIVDCSKKSRALVFDPCVPLLKSMIDEVKNTWPDDDGHVLSSESAQHDARKVFLVHGHDGEVKQTVARFLEKNGLKVIILDEIAAQGRTIIEKFEQHSLVGYAVVLMTPDDATEPPEDGASERRARQNVVFELGFFVGALKRGRVCVIVRGNVEKPSNYWGVEYIPWDDAGGWKLKLLEELKAANLAVSEG